MNLRKAAEAVKALGPTKAWSEANELANYYLYQPDMLAEAVALLRQAEILLRCYEYHPLPKQIADFNDRYDAAQQEQCDE